jgi:hypothetical protein
MSGYWERTHGGRLSRRRALAAAGGLGLAAGALSLVGCGGGDGDDSGSSGDASGLITPPKDTTSSAKTGGILGSFVSADPGSLDPVTGTATASRTHATYVYSRLFQFKPGVLSPSKGEVTGDFVESYEVLDGGLRLNLKFRQAGAMSSAPRRHQGQLSRWRRQTTVRPSSNWRLLTRQSCRSLRPPSTSSSSRARPMAASTSAVTLEGRAPG